MEASQRNTLECNMTQNIGPMLAAKIQNILSGSCTPAGDLLDLVDAGKLTAHEATQSLHQSGRTGGCVRTQAHAESVYMRAHNI